MSENLKQKFNKSKPEAAEPDTTPTDIQSEKEPKVQSQPNVEPQIKPDPEEESRQSKPEVPTAGPELTPETSEISNSSDFIGRSNVGSIIKLPSDESAPVETKSAEEVNEEPVVQNAEENDNVVADDTAEETVVEEAAPDEAVLEDEAEETIADEGVAEEITRDENVEEPVAEDTVNAEEAVTDEDVAEENLAEETDAVPEAANAPEGIIAEQNVTEAPADENEAAIEAAEEATEEATEETTEAIIDLNEVKSDGNQQIKSELHDQIDITEAETEEVPVDSAQGEGIPATD